MDNCFSTPQSEPVLSVSLGMVVIDEIHQPSRPPILDIAGGSGTYGTRIIARTGFLGSLHSFQLLLEVG